MTESRRHDNVDHGEAFRDTIANAELVETHDPAR